MSNIDNRLSELEKMLKLKHDPEPKEKVVTPIKETEIEVEDKSKIVKSPVEYNPTKNIEKDILSILKKEMTTLEIVAAVNKHAICSQATIFRYLKKLSQQGKIQRIRRGRHVFYKSNVKESTSNRLQHIIEENIEES